MNKHMSGRGRRNDIHSSDVHKSEIQGDDAPSGDMQVDLVERAALNQAQSGTNKNEIEDASVQNELTGDKTIEDETIQIEDLTEKVEQHDGHSGGDSDCKEANPIQDVVNEDTIAEYLIAHPDLFRRRPDILSKLQIPHVEAEGASSLVEKQVNRLRLELTNKHSHFEQVVESARMAEQQQARVHRITLALVSATTQAQVKERVLACLKVDFNIDFVSIRLHGEVETENTEAYAMLRDRVAQGRSFCDHRLPKRSMDWLFEGEIQKIASCAVVPISSEDSADTVLGIIGLGDADPDRFSRDMGTVYLDRLGQLVGAVMARL